MLIIVEAAELRMETVSWGLLFNPVTPGSESSAAGDGVKLHVHHSSCS